MLPFDACSSPFVTSFHIWSVLDYKKWLCVTWARRSKTSGESPTLLFTPEKKRQLNFKGSQETPIRGHIKSFYFRSNLTVILTLISEAMNTYLKVTYTAKDLFFQWERCLEYWLQWRNQQNLSGWQRLSMSWLKLSVTKDMFLGKNLQFLYINIQKLKNEISEQISFGRILKTDRQHTHVHKQQHRSLKLMHKSQKLRE